MAEEIARETNLTVKQQADRIRQRLADGALYGAPLDMSDENAVLVATYYLAMDEVTHRHINYLQEYLEWVKG